MNEEWRNISNHEGYQVSSIGRVRSIDRTIEVQKQRGQIKVNLRGRVLKPSVNGNGYFSVLLGAGKCKTVHSLVAEAFIGPRPDGFDINHIDGNKTNNIHGNLEYTTRKENIKHSYQLGLSNNTGDSHYKAKHSDEEFIAAYLMVANGTPQVDVARKFGMHKSTLNCLCLGLVRKHLRLKPLRTYKPKQQHASRMM